MKKKVAPKRPAKIRHKIQTDYLGRIYGKEFLNLIPKAVKKLRALQKKFAFDAIAFSGSSGAALAYPLSYLMKVPLIHVRKGRSHYDGVVEGTISSKRYVIVDDFIETGSTIRRIVRQIKSEMDAEPVAICLYSSSMTNDFHYNNKTIPIFNIPR